ncbi:uncharacterized protein LOC133188531 [Saccostrea echinata]|uniref:uncharacterized protein LOC133188531 n=1 Tax=Saccostrea echinata TaxID=191078 RepID=UPI002A7EA98F|nr:uncharacterized protein LOC133188531 [Saccostrea echinata]
MRGYLIRKKMKVNRKGVLRNNNFDKAMKQIARTLQQTGCLEVNQDALCLLTQWIDYVKELKGENERMEALETRRSQIDKIYQKMTQRIEMLEKQWNFYWQDDQSMEESP